MLSKVQSQVGAIRRSRGVGAADLAKRVGVSRQTIYAIEAGTYVPNTEVTLKLARELEVPVEELFQLQEDRPAVTTLVQSEILSVGSIAKGQAVKVVQVGERTISIPVNASPSYLPEADGVVASIRGSQGKAELVLFSGADEGAQGKKLVLAGCDPAIGLLSRTTEKISGVEIVSAAASSKLALKWLQQGKVHIAGSHLEDPATGEFNLPFLKSEFPGEDFAVVTFARWEEGFVTALGNPEGIAQAVDLTRKKVRFVNREVGSGSRALLDRLLEEAGVIPKTVCGYDRVAYGHLAAAYAVMANDADCCLATRSAARTFGLHFVPLQSERYDFVMRRSTMASPMAQGFLDVLQRASLRKRLEVLAGYDTSETGAVIA